MTRRADPFSENNPYRDAAFLFVSSIKTRGQNQLKGSKKNLRIGKFRVIALSKSENIADDYGGGEEKERNAMVFGRKLFQFGCNGAQAEVFWFSRKQRKVIYRFSSFFSPISKLKSVFTPTPMIDLMVGDHC